MLLIYTIVYLLSVLLYRLNHNYIASLIMISLAIFLYVNEVKIEKRIINVRGLFALGFIGGFGVSLLKLSKLSSEYSTIMLVAVFLAYFSMYVGVYLSSKNFANTTSKNEILKQEKINGKFTLGQKLILSIIFITFISFIIEVIKLKFIPLFTIRTPHAYSAFHVFMLHYITSFYSFVPSIAICNYFADKKNKTSINKIHLDNSIKLIIISFVYVVMMSLLLVSRSKLILSVVLSVFVYIVFNCDNKTKKKISKVGIISIALISVLFLILYIVITINRAHNIEYLNGIFEIKNEKLPIFISQPYMYIAHNFENLNYMINNTFRWTCGRRMLYPLFTLLFIKKFFPIVVDSPYYIIKQELSTVTIIYDAYYDFGLVGVIVFCFLLGYVGKRLEDKTYGILENMSENYYIVVLFALYCYYMLFSFFQTYFSLTDTWVYIILLTLLSKFIINKKISRGDVL